MEPPAQPPTSRPPAPPQAVGVAPFGLSWAACFALFAALFLLTCQRGPAWQDSGLFQWRIYAHDLSGRLGVALAHPLLIALAEGFARIPIGPLAWRYNAFSAIAAAVAAANLMLLVRRLTPPGRAGTAGGWFAAGAFGLAHTVWWLATITESHALLAAVMTFELLALEDLVRRPRAVAAVLLGMLSGWGLSTHNLALLALPAYGVTVVVLAWRGRLKWWVVPVFVLSWCLAAGLVLKLLIETAGQVGWPGAVASALFGRSWRGQVLGGSGRAVMLGFGYVLYNFPNLALPLAAAGLWRLRRTVGTHLAAAFAWITAAHFLFAIRYAVADQFMFFVPLYAMIALLAGLGVGGLWPGWRRGARAAAAATLLIGPMVYAAAPAAAKALHLPLPGSRRELPFRDQARYWLTPWKSGEDSAGRFARTALEQLAGRRAIVFADLTSYWPLRWVAEVERPGRAGQDLRLVLVADAELLSGPDRELMAQLARDPAGFLAEARALGTAVHVVSNVGGYFPAALAGRCEFEKDGVLYRVRPPADKGETVDWRLPVADCGPACGRGAFLQSAICNRQLAIPPLRGWPIMFQHIIENPNECR